MPDNDVIMYEEQEGVKSTPPKYNIHDSEICRFEETGEIPI